jgi:hypothetical protein
MFPSSSHLPIKLGLAALALTLAALACGDSTPENQPDVPTLAPAAGETDALPRGERTLELHLNTAENDDFEQSVRKAQALGAESVSLSIYWDDYEISPGVYQPNQDWLEIANTYYPDQDLQVSLVISVLDTTEVRLPEDLQGRSLADPEVIERFQAFLDEVHRKIPDLTLTSLAIGNEIDGVLGSDPARWQNYQTFFQAAAGHAGTLWPDTPVGTKIMFEGLTGSSADLASDLNRHSDVIMFTYYPLNGDFTVRDPGVIHQDLAEAAARYPDRKLYVAEIGYPTGEANGSSFQKQAEFIRAMFAAWDDHADQVPVLSYSWLTDLSTESVSHFQGYYGVSSRAFGEFLRTLGLRTYPGEGQDKPGYEAFLQETRARDW